MYKYIWATGRDIVLNYGKPCIIVWIIIHYHLVVYLMSSYLNSFPYSPGPNFKALAAVNILVTGWLVPWVFSAHQSAVPPVPLFVRVLRLAPFSMRYATISRCPPLAASWIGCHPFWSEALSHSGCLLRTTLNKSRFPLEAALCAPFGRSLLCVSPFGLSWWWNKKSLATACEMSN